MRDKKFSLSGTFRKTKEYIETQLQLTKLKAISKVSRIFSAILVDVSKVLLVLLIVFFFSLALGFYFGELFGSYSLGFLATGGIFSVLLLLVGILESKLEAKIMDVAIRKFMRKWNEDEDDEANDSSTSSSVENNEGQATEEK